MESDTPALNADGTLKDASELNFFNSPSNQRPLTTTDQHSDSGGSEGSDPMPRGFKGKQTADKVAGKRVWKASSKAQAQKGSFSEKNFTGEPFSAFFLYN